MTPTEVTAPTAEEVPITAEQIPTTAQTVVPQEQVMMFIEPPQLRLCTANVCTKGHEWIPKINLAKCGYSTPQGWNGCGAPILIVKQENCPSCNEPVAQLRFRTDHTPPVPYLSPLCIPGSQSAADVSEIVLTRVHRQVETEYDKKFPPLGLPEAPVETKQEKE